MRVDALGTVVPVASVAIKSRLDTTVEGVHFADGAAVKQGDLLFTLDGRAIEAQIKQAEGVLNSARAQLEQAERDVRRYSELVARNATPITNLDNARTQANIARALIEANTGQIEHLRVQLDYTVIRAPISGRASMAAVKVGNLVRPSDTSPLATINQMTPIYVSFAVPQRLLPEIQEAVDKRTTEVVAEVPGTDKRANGRVAMIDNMVDAATGMITLRALFDNKDELLWPGALVNVRLTLRTEEAVTVPAVAVQTGQGGTFVFVVSENQARARPVVVARTLDNEAVIANGLAGGETVVTDGQLLLADGVRVSPRRPQAGS